jgi:hypothetical protein
MTGIGRSKRGKIANRGTQQGEKELQLEKKGGKPTSQH